MLNMNERMNESLFNLNYKIISIVRLFNFTRSAILPHNLPKLYSTGRFSWSTICYCAGGRGLKVLNGTRPVEYTHYDYVLTVIDSLFWLLTCACTIRHYQLCLNTRTSAPTPLSYVVNTFYNLRAFARHLERHTQRKIYVIGAESSHVIDKSR